MSEKETTVTKPRRRWTQISLKSFLMLTAFSSFFIAWKVRQHQAYMAKQSRFTVTFWDPDNGENVKWRVKLGSQTYGTPVVSRGKIFVGTNNGAGYLPRYPATTDLGVLLCFREKDGKFLWQASSEKLKTGRVHDWPMQGLCSTPLVERDRLWYVTNRCEVVCLDTEGFYDKENDGPFKTEVNENRSEADVIWQFDMMGKLGVSPHNMSACSVAGAGNRLFVVTGNGLDESHVNLPSPDAPSFICLDKRTGKLLWKDDSPGKNIMHGQWGSPIYAVLGGTPQVLFPGGDGWLYSFDPRGSGGKGKLLWKFDCNPKKSQWMLGGRGTRNNLLRAPVLYKGRIYIAVGQDPEHGEGVGCLWCIDPTKRGDVSPELVFNKSDPNKPVPHKRLLACDELAGDFVKPNPNSAVIWKYEATDFNGNGEIEFEEEFHRSLNGVAIQDDLIIAVDFSGMVYCIDAITGKGYWAYDTLAASWAAPLIAGEHVYVTDEDGDVAVFRLSRDPKIAMRGVTKAGGSPHQEIWMPSSIYATPVVANNVLYITTKNELFALHDQSPKKKKK